MLLDSWPWMALLLVSQSQCNSDNGTRWCDWWWYSTYDCHGCGMCNGFWVLKDRKIGGQSTKGTTGGRGADLFGFGLPQDWGMVDVVMTRWRGMWRSKWCHTSFRILRQHQQGSTCPICQQTNPGSQHSRTLNCGMLQNGNILKVGGSYCRNFPLSLSVVRQRPSV